MGKNGQGRVQFKVQRQEGMGVRVYICVYMCVCTRAGWGAHRTRSLRDPMPGPVETLMARRAPSQSWERPVSSVPQGSSGTEGLMEPPEPPDWTQ